MSLCRIVFVVAALGGLVVLTSCTVAYSMLGLLMFLGKSLGDLVLSGGEVAVFFSGTKSS